MQVRNSFCFMLNSLALGDVIAAAPVVKYMVDNYYTPDTYMVVAKEMFRPIFWFIPDANFHNFEDSANSWDIPLDWAIGCLNTAKTGTTITRPLPKCMLLGQYASIQLASRVLTEEQLIYLPLLPVDIGKFNYEFHKAIIIVSSYRDDTRMWPVEEILTTALWIKSQGYIPVFIGKTDMNLDTHLIPKSSLPANLGSLGIDLRNKTSLEELATIMGNAKAVIGLDSGPIHLAGTTCVNIICGYTTVSPEYRLPIRQVDNTYAIIPDIDCRHCESREMSNFWNYENCPLGDAKCCKEMTAKKFIAKLKEIL